MLRAKNTPHLAGISVDQAEDPVDVEIANNLPAERTSFVGRAVQIVEISRLLRSTRVVTLTGSGGSGKTRLALRVAAVVIDEHRDGVWFVDLAPLTDDRVVPAAIASAIGIQEAPFEAPLDALVHRLGLASTLLVLDNCEHLIAACAGIADVLLRRCPQVRLLVTSREPLGVEGELVWPVTSLSLPDSDVSDLTRLADVEAVRLFLDRASLAVGGFDLTDENARAVADICRRLDGIPLAIELAAARTRMMTPIEICAGLDDRFRVLSAGRRSAIPRQRTLEASVDWSYRLLDDDERAVLRRLAVMVGGFTLEAAGTVYSDVVVAEHDILRLLSSLVDKSLVAVADQDSATRYAMLETTRQFAASRLAENGDELTDSRDRHLDFFVALAERGEQGFEGPQLFEWAARLRADLGNVRAAIEWAAQIGNADKALRITCALPRFWWLHGQREGIDHVTLALSIPGASPDIKAKALVAASLATIAVADFGTAARFAEEAIEIGREIGDDQIVGRAYCWLGWATTLFDPAAARDHFDRSIELATRTADHVYLADALNGRGSLEVRRGDPSLGRAFLRKALSIGKESGNEFIPGYVQMWLGWAEMSCGRLDDAETHFGEACQRARRLRETFYEASSLVGLALAALRRDDVAEARRYAAELGSAVPAGNVFAVAMAAVTNACVALAQGKAAFVDPELDAHLTTNAVTLPGLSIHALLLIADAALAAEDEAAATARVEQAQALVHTSGSSSDGARVRAVSAAVAVERGDVDEAEGLAHDALAASVAIDDAVGTIEALEVIASVSAACQSPIPAVRVLAATHRAREDTIVARTSASHARHHALIAQLHASMSDEEFTAAWADGTEMRLETVVASARRGRGSRRRPIAGWASLTPTERQVADHIAEGLTNPEIAARMFVARSTVKGHVSSILRKLGVRTRAELAAATARHETTRSG